MTNEKFVLSYVVFLLIYILPPVDSPTIDNVSYNFYSAVFMIIHYVICFCSTYVTRVTMVLQYEIILILIKVSLALSLKTYVIKSKYWYI